MKILTLPLTKKKKKERERERERGAKTYSNFKNISKTPEKFSLVTLQARNQEIFKAGEFSWI